MKKNGQFHDGGYGKDGKDEDLLQFLLKLEENDGHRSSIGDKGDDKSSWGTKDKYNLLYGLQLRNPDFFYRSFLANISVFAPIMYTPTIGLMCQNSSFYFQQQYYERRKFIVINLEMKGNIKQILQSLYQSLISTTTATTTITTLDPQVIVVTDGSRILGLGDLGIGGVGIPIGKISLYIVGAGFNHKRALPIVIDVGSDNDSLLQDPNYPGLRRKRPTREEYHQFMDEFVTAVKSIWPHTLLQFEDFSSENAFAFLSKYRENNLCFNDDIQGTAAVVLAGLISGWKVQSSNTIIINNITDNSSRDNGITAELVKNQRILFYGAGSAALGVADYIVSYFQQVANVSVDEAKNSIYLFDSQGLITNVAMKDEEKKNTNRQKKEYYARNDPNLHHELKNNITSLLQVVKLIKPTVLIGFSTQFGAFTNEILSEMASHVDRPIVMPLSNPTSKAECTLEEAVNATRGKVLFASGSPFKPVTYSKLLFAPQQCNNFFIFPGLGLGAYLSRSKLISDSMIFAAAEKLASLTTTEDILTFNSLYPNISDIRNISHEIAADVFKIAISEGLSSLPATMNIRSYIHSQIYSLNTSSLL